MKTVTIEEASSALRTLVDSALAGEQVQIRLGNRVVELRPASPLARVSDDLLSPRRALQLLQDEARLSPEKAEAYIAAVRDERSAEKQ